MLVRCTGCGFDAYGTGNEGVVEMWFEKGCARVRSKMCRLSAQYLFRRRMIITSDEPFISFTFDDFPHSAFSVGGAILKKYGLFGTFYVSLGLTGKQDVSGLMFSRDDLAELHRQGHEIGCHTFDHCDSSETAMREFVESVALNQNRMDTFIPGVRLRTFSFPKSAPRARTKREVGRRFECCRGSGQSFNTGVVDLNYLCAYFLEKANGDLSAVRHVIDEAKKAKGWLIFATHDVSDDPSRYGCTPLFFEEVVRYAVESQAVILPVVDVLNRLQQKSELSGAQEK